MKMKNDNVLAFQSGCHNNFRNGRHKWLPALYRFEEVVGQECGSESKDARLQLELKQTR